jgi:hypothetical protein
LVEQRLEDEFHHKKKGSKKRKCQIETMEEKKLENRLKISI